MYKNSFQMSFYIKNNSWNILTLQQNLGRLTTSRIVFIWGRYLVSFTTERGTLYDPTVY